MKLDVQIEKPDDGVVLVSVTGDVDLYSSPELRKHILSQTKSKTPVIIVDLQNVDYMDSSGVATLVEGLQQVNKYKGKLLISNLCPGVKEVFELSRLDRVFDIYDTSELAKEAIG